MYDAREKLINLIEEAYYCSIEEMADHLIAGGVTLENQVSSSKWISVKDRLPSEEYDWVLVVVELHSRYGIFNSVPIVAELRRGEWYDSQDETIEGEFETVTHWMPLPQPPNEVSQ